jgi:hypothetical protein
MSRGSAAHRGDERNLIIIVNRGFTVNVFSIERKCDGDANVGEGRMLSLQLMPQRLDGNGAGELSNHLGGSHALAHGGKK